jgi:hypothetical protein
MFGRGVAGRDLDLVWAVDRDSRLSDDEYAKADRRALNPFDALVRGSGVTRGSRIPRHTAD